MQGITETHFTPENHDFFYNHDAFDDSCSPHLIPDHCPRVQHSAEFHGQIHSINVGFTDEGVQDTHEATIDWREGSGPEPATVTQGAGSGTVSGSHQYLALGAYTITVTVTDDDGGLGSASGEKKVLLLPVFIDIKPGGNPQQHQPGEQRSDSGRRHQRRLRGGGL